MKTLHVTILDLLWISGSRDWASMAMDTIKGEAAWHYVAPDEKVSAPRVLPKRQKLSLIKRLDPADNEQHCPWASSRKTQTAGNCTQTAWILR